MSLHYEKSKSQEVSNVAHRLDVQQRWENFRLMMHVGLPVILLAGAAIACGYVSNLAPTVVGK